MESIKMDTELEGNIQQANTDLEDTLDEPVSETLKRDVLMVFRKFQYVLLPLENKKLLRDWDLWGPLILCVTLALTLMGSSSDDQHALVFSGIFVIVWCGAGVVTLNSKLLGGELSFFQSICVLGYCILPLVISALFGRLIATIGSSAVYWTVRTLVVLGAFVWSVYASMVFLAGSQPAARRALAVYPIFLFYFVIAWLVLMQPKNQ
eukprot:Colp12_sorted_trinity150504_noHs@29212